MSYRVLRSSLLVLHVPSEAGGKDLKATGKYTGIMGIKASWQQLRTDMSCLCLLLPASPTHMLF